MKYLEVVVLLVAVTMVVVVVGSTSSDETFTEELYIKVLGEGGGGGVAEGKLPKLLTHFQFTTRWNPQQHQQVNDYELFPKSLGQTIAKFQIDELHLSFTQGRWWTDRWGYPILAAPVGSELWAWFDVDADNQTSSKVDQLWRGLTGTLSGMFCASLEQMKTTVTGQPHYSFRHEGAHVRTDSDRVRYSILPREAVCTENLTPWIKLLPCRAKAGLASLLNALTLYDVSYHSMGVHIRHICLDKDCTSPVLELAQTLTVVFDPAKHSWSFQSLFKKSAISACPLASSSQIFVDMADTERTFKLDPEPSTQGSMAIYDLKKMASPLSLSIQLLTDPGKKKAESDLLLVQRYFTGYGQEFGGIAVHIFNHANCTVKATYYELIPWYLRVYFHTFTVYVNNVKYDPTEIFETYKFIPAEERGAPTTIEFLFSLPARSTIYFTLQFEKAFLHWTEHPPDAHRGFDIGSAVITAAFEPSSKCQFSLHGLDWSSVIFGTSSSPSTPIRIYTEGLLVSLPTPDFSMPYNVITLTGTIFALFFGSVLNVLIRRMKHLERIDNDFVSTRPIARLARKLLQFIDGK